MLAAGGPGCSPRGCDLPHQDVTAGSWCRCQPELSPRCHPQSRGGGSESRGRFRVSGDSFRAPPKISLFLFGFFAFLMLDYNHCFSREILMGKTCFFSRLPAWAMQAIRLLCAEGCGWTGAPRGHVPRGSSALRWPRARPQRLLVLPTASPRSHRGCRDPGGFTDSRLLWTQFSPTRSHYILGHCQLFPPGSLCSIPPPRRRKRLQRGNRAAGAAADSRPVYTCARGSHSEQCHAWRSRATRAWGPAPLRLPGAGDSERGQPGAPREMIPAALPPPGLGASSSSAPVG